VEIQTLPRGGQFEFESLISLGKVCVVSVPALIKARVGVFIVKEIDRLEAIAEITTIGDVFG
jgi:hypothetical protein